MNIHAVISLHESADPEVETAWDLLDPASLGDARYTWRTVKRGQWLDPPARRVYELLGTEAQLSALYAALEAVEPGCIAAIYTHYYETGGVPRSEAMRPTVGPAALVSIMPPHRVIDPATGEQTGYIPATLENPNWPVGWAGAKPRRVGNAFGLGFSEGFS